MFNFFFLMLLPDVLVSKVFCPYFWFAQCSIQVNSLLCSLEEGTPSCPSIQIQRKKIIRERVNRKTGPEDFL